MRARARLQGATVGYLELTGDLTVFRFAPEYLEMPVRPTLGRWFEDRISPDIAVKGGRSELPSFFQNYLPEPGSGLRELLARRAGVPANRELPLLCALGEDLPGALVVDKVLGNGQAVAPAESEPAGAATDAEPPSGPLRFSLAGMQLKFSVLQHERKFTFPVTGVGGRWILKVPSTTFADIAENEHAVMAWARRSGITVPDVQLVALDEIENLPDEIAAVPGRALLVERFDRPREGGQRVHQEDFAQVFGVRATEKYGREALVTYDRLGKVIATICGRADFEEFVRRLVFNVLCENPDAHLKNWSLVYPDGRRPRLSPAYDLVSTTIYPAVHRELACRLAGAWQIDEIRAHHFGKLASRAGFDASWGVTIAEDAATRSREAWNAIAREIEMPRELVQRITKRLSDAKLP